MRPVSGRVGLHDISAPFRFGKAAASGRAPRPDRGKSMAWDQCRSQSGDPRGLTGRVHSISARGTGEGPGVRFVIFLHGCPLRCAHCSDKERRGSDGGTASAIDELVEQIAHYADFMRISGGGVTVAGAEPLEQAQFVRELFRRCRDMGIQTALDTSGGGNVFAAKGLLHLTDLVV